MPKKSADAKKLADALNKRQGGVEGLCRAAPGTGGLNGSAVGTRLFEPAQGYLYSAPEGIGAADVWGLAGAKGKGITICDIEGAWNRSTRTCHRASRSSAATMIADLGWRNHGTAVLGEMISVADGEGLRRHQPRGEGGRPFRRDRRRLQPGRR